MPNKESIKQFRVFWPSTGTVVDLWAYNLEEVYKEAGEPGECELKIMVPGKGWRTVCSLHLVREKRRKGYDLLLPSKEL